MRFHNSLIYIHPRPYLLKFMNEVSKEFLVILFTASLKDYADPVLNVID